MLVATSKIWSTFVLVKRNFVLKERTFRFWIGKIDLYLLYKVGPFIPFFELNFLGPLAESVLQKHTKGDLSKLTFFTGGFYQVDGAESYIQRSGYTGEDGFEVFSKFNVGIHLMSLGFYSNPCCCWNCERSSCSSWSHACRSWRSRFSSIRSRTQSLWSWIGWVYNSKRSKSRLDYLEEKVEPNARSQFSTFWSSQRQAEGGFIGDKRILAELPGKIGELRKRRVGLFIEGAPARELATIHHPKTEQQIGSFEFPSFFCWCY